MYGLLDAVYKENYAGRATVLQVFKITKVRPDRRLPGHRRPHQTRRLKVRVIRDGQEVCKGKIASLKRVKDDVSEVRSGVECGIDLAGYKDIKAGDIIEAFTTEKLADELGRNTLEAKKERELADLKAAKDVANEVARAEAETANA